jgi:hypothetical protein
MNIVRIELPEGLSNEAAVDRLAAAGCTDATVGVGKAGVLVLDYGDGPLDWDAVSRAVLALGLEDFERCSIRTDDDLDTQLGLSGLLRRGHL